MFVKYIVPKLICLYEGCPVIGSILNIVVLYVNYVTKQCLGFCTFSLKIGLFLFIFFFLFQKRSLTIQDVKVSIPPGHIVKAVERGGARHLVGPTCTLTNPIPIKVHMCKTSYSCVCAKWTCSWSLSVGSLFNKSSLSFKCYVGLPQLDSFD